MDTPVVSQNDVAMDTYRQCVFVCDSGFVNADGVHGGWGGYASAPAAPPVPSGRPQVLGASASPTVTPPESHTRTARPGPPMAVSARPSPSATHTISRSMHPRLSPSGAPSHSRTPAHSRTPVPTRTRTPTLAPALEPNTTRVGGEEGMDTPSVAAGGAFIKTYQVGVGMIFVVVATVVILGTMWVVRPLGVMPRSEKKTAWLRMLHGLTGLVWVWGVSYNHHIMTEGRVDDGSDCTDMNVWVPWVLGEASFVTLVAWRLGNDAYRTWYMCAALCAPLVSGVLFGLALTYLPSALVQDEDTCGTTRLVRLAWAGTVFVHCVAVWVTVYGRSKGCPSPSDRLSIGFKMFTVLSTLCAIGFGVWAWLSEPGAVSSDSHMAAVAGCSCVAMALFGSQTTSESARSTRIFAASMVSTVTRGKELTEGRKRRGRDATPSSTGRSSQTAGSSVVVPALNFESISAVEHRMLAWEDFFGDDDGGPDTVTTFRGERYEHHVGVHTRESKGEEGDVHDAPLPGFTARSGDEKEDEPVSSRTFPDVRPDTEHPVVSSSESEPEPEPEDEVLAGVITSLVSTDTTDVMTLHHRDTPTRGTLFAPRRPRVESGDGDLVDPSDGRGFRHPQRRRSSPSTRRPDTTESVLPGGLVE